MNRIERRKQLAKTLYEEGDELQYAADQIIKCFDKDLIFAERMKNLKQLLLDFANENLPKEYKYEKSKITVKRGDEVDKELHKELHKASCELVGIDSNYEEFCKSIPEQVPIVPKKVKFEKSNIIDNEDYIAKNKEFSKKSAAFYNSVPNGEFRKVYDLDGAGYYNFIMNEKGRKISTCKRCNIQNGYAPYTEDYLCYLCKS